MANDRHRTQRFEAIAEQVADRVQLYLRRRATAHDADDAYSETLLTVWRRLDDVPADDALPWVYGVARRVLSNQRRGSRRNLNLVERIGGVAPQPAAIATDPADHDPFPEVRQALVALPEPDQEVLTLWAWEELEPREIAQVLGTTPNAVSLRLARARQKLAQALERQDEADAGQEPVEAQEERSSGHE